MKRIMGVVGSKGKLGSLLVGLPNFVSLDCDVTSPLSIERALMLQPVDLIVNMAGISSVNSCEGNYDKAIEVNTKGTHNLHKIFGEGVLTISSDHVYNGKSKYLLPNEKTNPDPINNYGFTKIGAEAVSRINGGKVIRLSRTVSIQDWDIASWMTDLWAGRPIYVPTFFYRNYTHRIHAVAGIGFFANNFETLPDLVNFASSDNTSYYEFIRRIAEAFHVDMNLVTKRDNYLEDMGAPRPKRGGFRVNLAKGLGFPVPTLKDTINRLLLEPNVL